MFDAYEYPMDRSVLSVMFAWRAGCPSVCLYNVAKTLLLDICTQTFQPIFSYQLCLQAPLTSTIFYCFKWPWLWLGITTSVENRTCCLHFLTHLKKVIRMKFGLCWNILLTYFFQMCYDASNVTKLFSVIPGWMTLTWPCKGRRLWEIWNLYSQSDVYWHEVAQSFVMVDDVSGMTTLGFCRYGKCGLSNCSPFLVHMSNI